MRAWVAVALLGLALFATGVHQARAAEADPSVWGLYAKLPGATLRNINLSTEVKTWRWGNGNEIIEDIGSGDTRNFKPGPNTGDLLITETNKNGRILSSWTGKVGVDGSVLIMPDKTGLFGYSPYRTQLIGSELVYDGFRIKNGQVVSTGVWLRMSGQFAAATVQPASMPGGAAANSMAVVPSSPALPIGPTPPPLAARVSTTNANIDPPKAVPSTPTMVFGPIGALDGQQFAGNTLSLTVHVTNGGRTLTLDQVSGTSTYVLNATDAPGTYSVAVHPNMLHEYHHEDSFVGHLNDDGSIEVRYRTRGVSGSKYASDLYRFDGNHIVIERYSENWNGRRMVGSPDTYVPATPELLQAALANAVSVTRAREEGEIENRRAEAQRGAMFNSVLQGVAAGLAGGSTGGYAEAQANLDATVANIQNAATVERQQQAQAAQQAQARSAEEQSQKLAANARWVAEKEQAAAKYRSDQINASAAPAPSQSVVRQNPNSAGSSSAQSKTSGAAMTFLMEVSVDTIINRMNGTCYSNLVTIPGPPGWPVFDHTNDRKAAALVDAYKAGFLAQCGQAGPVRSGNFSYIWNARGSESRLAEEYARQQRNKMFQVQVSP